MLSLRWMQSTYSIKYLQRLLTENWAKYHKTYFRKSYMKNERPSE